MATTPDEALPAPLFVDTNMAASCSVQLNTAPYRTRTSSISR